jgi:agmatinase
MSNVTFHGDDVVPSPPDKALFHILPVPLEKTVSYSGGTVHGPQALLEASCQLELFDGKSIPAEYGIHTAAPLDCSPAMEDTLAALRKSVSDALAYGGIPVVLGGEHSLSLACIQGLKEHHNDFGVIQFDAHADLRNTYEGGRHSHACVMRRIFEENIPIYQIGTRSYCLEEHRFRQEKGIPYCDAETIWHKGAEAVVLPPDFPEKVYITFDVDCFDTSLMPATGTPVPGGLLWYQVTDILQSLFAERICLGFDLVELAPREGMHGSTFTVAQLCYTMMGYLVRSAGNRAYYALPRCP